MHSIEVRFTFSRRPYDYSNVSRGPTLFLDVNTTLDEVIRLLIQRQFLLPLDDPHLRYDIQLLETYEWTDHHVLPQRMGHTNWFSEGRTLAASIYSKKTAFLVCNITIVESPPSPKKKPDSTSPSLSETISTVATVGITILTVTASLATIIQTFIVVQERWEKTHQTRKAGSPQHFPQPGKTDIYAVRLRMTDGRDHTLQKWLTDPDELKHFIDVFNQPSSNMKPTEVVFVLWNRDTICVDVTKGAQGNLQLDEMLKYLNM